MNGEVREELMSVATEWDRAMLENDPESIGRFMADDWVIIGPDGSVSDKSDFLRLVESGALTHDVMESSDMRVRVYGDAAVVVARGVSAGRFHGQPFHLIERATSVFVRQASHWRCVLTHLSALAGE